MDLEDVEFFISCSSYQGCGLKQVEEVFKEIKRTDERWNVPKRLGYMYAKCEGWAWTSSEGMPRLRRDLES